MIAPAPRWLIAGLAVAVLQTAAIGWMVWDRIQLLKTGREIVLPVIPVDPRSLFRGDYVILNYDASMIPAALIPPELAAARPASFYVTFARTAAEWRLVAVAATAPPPAPDRISIKARTRYGWRETRRPRAASTATNPSAGTPEPPRELALAVRYGIESYFVPEGSGKPLEVQVVNRKLAAVIAVDARGNAAIKGLMIDGKLQYEEPLL
jgi:uncharacterized membrane-anchored protein